MSVEYRASRPGDEPGIFKAWESLAAPAAWLDTDWRGVPDHHDHAFVAVDGSGVLAVVVQVPRLLRDLRGEPVRVGGIAAVATRPDARRRGHARRLLELAIESMNGFGWSLLFSGTPEVYTSLGWRDFPLHVRSGVPVAGLGDRPVVPGKATDWKPLSVLYDAFNESTPLSAIRTERNWTHGVGRRLAANELLLFEDRGYVAFADRPGTIEVTELAVQDTAAAEALLAGVARRAARTGARVRLFLPIDPRTEPAVQRAFTDLRDEPFAGMALPLATSQAELTALAGAPNAVFWLADGF